MHCSYFGLSRIFNMWRNLHYKYKNMSTTIVSVTSFTMVCDVKFLCFQTKCFLFCFFYFHSRAWSWHCRHHQAVCGCQLPAQVWTGDPGEDCAAQYWSGRRTGRGVAAVQQGAEPVWDGDRQHNVHNGFLWRYELWCVDLLIILHIS